VCALVFTYIGVEFGVAPRRSSLGHAAQPGEVLFLALDLLILFSPRGVFTREVKVTQGSTHSRHDLLELLLLLVSEAVLLLVVALVAGVILVGSHTCWRSRTSSSWDNR
jgi:hypothetical protein